MNPNAMETFTPPGMGGDADLAAARRQIPPNICMIGGFDQFHFFKGCTRGADAGRGPPLLRGGGPQRRVYPLPLRQFLRGRAGSGQSLCRRGTEVRLPNDGQLSLEGNNDMRYEMKMPDLATTESEIRIVRWIVGPGQKVERGQPLLEVETDKATMEVESAVSGVLEEVRSPGRRGGIGRAS